MVEDKIFPISAARDWFECAHFDITDDLLMKSKIVAYMMDQQIKKTEDAEKKPYAPKAFPTKAVDIMIPLSDDFIIEIFLDTNAKAWDSKFRYNGKICKLSHEQMGQFFNSNFYKKMAVVLKKKWPLSDKTYGDLFNAVASKRMKVGFSEADLTEDKLVEVDSDVKNQPRKDKKLANKDVTGDNERDYTGSGRRILHFSDTGVKTSSGMYYCWPRKDAEFRWSQWRDWHKLRPFCKMEFEYNGRQYMLALSLFDENFENRGFRACDLEWEPPLAWLTPGECEDVMKLSIVRKFTKQCVKRITKYLKMPDEEILKKINKPDKISIDEIRETKRAIKKVVDSALKTNKADTFSWK